MKKSGERVDREGDWCQNKNGPALRAFNWEVKDKGLNSGPLSDMDKIWNNWVKFWMILLNTHCNSSVDQSWFCSK